MDDFNDFFGFVGGFALLTLLIAAFVFGIILVIPATIAVVIGMVMYAHYSPTSKHNLDKAEIAETQALYEEAQAMAPISEEEFQDFALVNFESLQCYVAAVEIFNMEGFTQPAPPPPVVTGIEGGRYRDDLKRYLNLAHDPGNVESFKQEIVKALSPSDYSLDQSGFFDARRYLNNEEIEELIMGFFGEHRHFKPMRNIIDRNLNEQGGIFPTEYRGDNCAWDYLKDTPLLDLEYRNITVDWKNRDSHTLVLAGSGAGKTTLFKHMIAKLLKEDCCVVVMDSQSQLIEELAAIQLDDDDITWISPEHKLALNPFDADPDELKDEIVLNNKISLLQFVIEHLIEAPMVTRQKTLFHHCCELVLSIPGGNVETFKEVLKDPFEFANYIDDLDETARKFFNEDLRSGGGKGQKNSYDGTRHELSYRLDGLIKQATFRRIFQTEENTFDFYTEMQERKLILLDTNQALLTDASPTFGRLFVAQALQACFQRVRNKETKRPVIFFIDEAHEVFDDKLERMLLQARKANVGMVLAMQDFVRATKAGLTDTLIGSTNTKLVSQVVVGDARKLAPRMKAYPEFLIDLPEHVFAFASGNQETVTVRADADPLADLEKRPDLKDLKEEMEYQYGPEQSDKENEDSKSSTSSNASSAQKGSKDEPKTFSDQTMSQNEDQDIKPTDTL